MRILFVSGNREKLPDPVIPLGLLYLVASVPDRHPRRLLDLCFEDDPFTVLGETVREYGPEVVAIGMRNIQNNDYSGTSDNLDYYAKLVSTSKVNSTAPVVIGGAGFSIMPRELMQQLDADFGIPGEGEEAFPQLIDALEGGKDISNIANLYYRDVTGEGRVLQGPPAAGFLDIAELRIPDRRLADPRYFSDYGIDSVQTKRGCRLKCDYCTYPIIEGRSSRLRQPEAVVEEMFAAVELNPSTQHVFFVDSVFNLPPTHAKNICRELIRQNWQIPWTCYANPLGFDREFADLAAGASCAGMEIGSDSGVDEVLRNLRKGFAIQDIRTVSEICSEVGIPDCHTFILGTQGETLEDSRQTLDFIAELDPFSAIIMIWIDDYESLDPANRDHRMALRADIEALLLSRQQSQPTWIVPGLGINFGEELFATARSAGLRGPLWQHIRGPRRSSQSSTFGRSIRGKRGLTRSAERSAST